MEEMTLDDLQSAIRGAHDVKPAPLTDADVAPKRNPLSSFVPGTQTNPILLPEQTITATPENDLTQDDIERVLKSAMLGGSDEQLSQFPIMQKIFNYKKNMQAGSLAALDIPLSLPAAGVENLAYWASRTLGMEPEERAKELAKQVSEPFTYLEPGKLAQTFADKNTIGQGSKAYEQSFVPQIMKAVDQYGIQPVKDKLASLGLSPQDADQVVNTVMLGIAPHAIPPVFGGLKTGAKAGWDWMRESPPVKGAAQWTHELKTGETPPPPAPIEPMMDVNQQPSQMIGGGAASTSPAAILQGNIDAALANASPELQAHIKSKPIESVNVPALETRALEEKHGINLTTGQRTGDTQLYSQEWNKRGETPTLGSHFDAQPQQISSAFESAKQRHAPDIPSTADASELGQHQINALAAKDKIRTDAISNAYKDLTDAAGGQFPIDIDALDKNIQTSLGKNLKTNHLSKETQSDLNDFYQNPTFEMYEHLRSNLADEMRTSGSGRTKQAAFIVRQELEKLPVFNENESAFNPQAAQLKALADKARGLVAERYSVLNGNPAYKAAVKEYGTLEDAASQGESLNAANFHKKFISDATPEKIRRIKAEIPPDDIAHQAIAFGELERAKNASVNASERNITPEQFVKFLRNNKSNLRESLSPEAMQDVSEIGALTSKIGMPKTGVFNYSNTYSSELANLAKQGLTSAAEAKLTSMTGGASYPITQLGRQWFSNLNKEGFAKKATDPTGGLTKE